MDNLLNNIESKRDDMEDELNAICNELGEFADQVSKIY